MSVGKMKEQAASGEGESRVSSKTRGGKGRTVVVVAAAGTTAAVAGEAILNTLITGVIFEKITLLDSGITVETLLIMTIL